MTKLSEGDFIAHKNCSIGDTIVAKDDENNEYTGIVQEIKGATVYVLSNNSNLLEFRRIQNKYEKVIFLGIDGKNKSIQTEKKTKTKEDIDITKETYELDFDKNIISFDAEHESKFIG